MAQLMRTSNPALSSDAFRTGEATFGESMTVSGTVNKTGILLLCCVATAAWTWNRFFNAPPEEAMQAMAPALAIGGIGGLIVAIVTIFKKEWAGITAPIYALLEGLVLGGISAMLETRYHGIAIQAVSLTFGTLLVMLLAYRSGLIKVTERLRLGIVAATGGIAVFYLLQFILGFFGVHFTAINGSSPIGIGFSLIVVAVAALNLVLDFDLIENGARLGAPKYMEWYGAFALMITLIWLYFEILRLLSKFRSR
ncbi:MAG TPA: Bax inhibitor-1/YccA family protein [Candidatus Limnocylindrales bacterium]|nr:Bax inhibitor-1/YccA family protein [Candidatus Limnocylindrales bacterium]